MKALIEAMVFSASAKNKPAVIDTITKHFKLSDPAAADSAYQDIVALIRAEEYRKPYVSVEGLRGLQRIMKTQNPKIGEINTDNLVDTTVIRKIDESGFFEKLYAQYGVK